MDNRSLFHQAVAELQAQLLDMASHVQQSIHQAVDALARLDAELAKKTIAHDDVIDQMMLDIEEACGRLIVRQQPMASDLRIIQTARKISTDLERIADHAVDIAKIVLRIADEQLVKPLITIPQMAQITIDMLQDSLNSYTQRDVNLAASLAEKENQVDRIYAEVLQELIMMMGNDYTRNRQLSHLTFVVHYLERVADHVTNIGEDVIYMLTGKRKDLNI
ncbi:phosphate signaling complex protein PhoU [Paenibacillus sp. N1-5-1-14]|uniref:phosphate signaling complex protein PhoU n=1 Tax=Paenibacillus radicibacter TaxID=2972488 RepID=UPI00215935D5|nr:phosphate signaling complex protein PhoU [Paenibacillus radicibacter]MCR8643734.1 phosphate signaling complex protein PhoU [Paenibacillus radicibacter]